MDPLPESARAFDELDPMSVDDGLLDQLRVESEQVRRLVPDCVGLSLTMREQGVTLTLVADPSLLAVLDAVQYVDDGPCERAVLEAEVIAVVHESMDEAGWHLFAAATATRGVASTLSMPVLVDGVVRGGINLYGSSPTCFDGHHQELADVLGAWAEGAVTNADLTFSTRLEARRAPELLKQAALVDVAVGLLAARAALTLDEARERLAEAALQAGADLPELAGLVADLLGGPRE